MEAVMIKHKPYTPEYKLSAVLDPDSSTCLAANQHLTGLGRWRAGHTLVTACTL
jgi:hypothetical protein